MILALLGPTASGKTSIALDLARDFDAEIIACDSMTIYRGIDIGTAKPSAAQRASVPHHLLDIADPMQRFTVAQFQREARAAIEEIRTRGHLPMIVGGSGLYFRAIVDDLAFPPADPAVRARLEEQDDATLRTMLHARDPDAFSFVDPANRRRMVRALEVVEITRRPFSSYRTSWERYDAGVVAAGLRVPPEEQSRRIEHRLRAMLQGGLLDEVRTLVAAGYREAITSSRAIGYAQAIGVIEGTITPDQFVTDAARATRRFARRQMSWFKRDPRIRWFDASDTERAREEIRAYFGHALQEE